MTIGQKARQRRGWVACVVLLALAGCTLSYDPTATEFEERRDEGVLNNAPANNTPTNNNTAPNNSNNTTANNTPTNNDPNNDPNNTPNNDPNNTPNNNTPPPVARLGSACGPLGTLCQPDAEGWPACLDTQCQETMDNPAARCLRGAGLWGYCSLACSTDAECVGSPRDAFAQTMRCHKEAGAPGGLCRPGSQEDCTSDLDCPGLEVCKLAQVGGSAGAPHLAQVCQSPTASGALPGAYCNERREKGVFQRCVNDLCADDICTSLCEEGDTCGSANQTCRGVDTAELGLGVSEAATLCAPSPCLTAADCVAEGSAAYCAPAYIGEEGIAGYCRTDNPSAEGSEPLGASCMGASSQESDDARCASRFCTGYTVNYHCSGACRSDNDCGDDQVCDVTAFDDGSGGTYFANVCKYARGSRRGCTFGEVCPDGESCAPYLFGEVVGGGQEVADGEAVGMCVTNVTGLARGAGGAGGQGCAERGCVVYGGCLQVVGEDESWCSNVCWGDEDCEPNFTCTQLTYLGSDETSDGFPVSLRMCRRR